MKRILALFCVLACLCCLCIPALAANDKVTVHAYAPDSWESVRLWAWDDNDQNPADAGTWPGNLYMTKGADGWYTIEISTVYHNMLVNADGNKQTGDFKGVDVSKDVWIVVNEDGTAQIYDSKPDVNAPAEPPKLNNLAVVGEGIPGVGNWIVEDPAGDMVKVSSKVYTKEIAMTAGTVMQFKFAGNDSWNSGYNFGAAADGVVVNLGQSMELASGADSKNLNLTVDKNCTLKFTVTVKDGNATLLVEEVAGSADGDVVAPPAPVVLNSLALVGDGLPGIGTWIVDDPAGDMLKVADNVYCKEIAVTAGTTMQFKIAGNDTWDGPYNFGGAQDGVVVALGTALDLASGNESKNLSLTADKDCTLKFTVTLTDGAASLVVEEVEAQLPDDSEPDATAPGASEPETSKPAETKPAETKPVGENEGETPDFSLLIVIIGGVAAVAVAAVVIIVLKKKK